MVFHQQGALRLNSEKDCFGVLEKVFPLGEAGLREITPSCFECPEKTACLRTALESREGLSFRAEIMDRSPAEGVWDRLKRWSYRKELSRRVRAREGNRR